VSSSDATVPRKPLSCLTAEELLSRAAELDAMAATATTSVVQQSLELLAQRFRVLAAERATSDERLTQAAGSPASVRPGETASQGGLYRQFNAFGSPTDHVVRVGRGERLSKAPRGYSWRRVSE
jgi:hypothetical protein